MRAIILFLLLTIITPSIQAQSIRESLDDIEDQIMQDRMDRLLDKLIENNQKIKPQSNSSSGAEINKVVIGNLIKNSPCNVAYITKGFERFTPSLEAIEVYPWTVVRFDKTSSLVFIPSMYTAGATENQTNDFLRALILKHLAKIRSLCPNIPANLLSK